MITESVIGVRADGVTLVQRFSDRGVMLRKVGTDEVYADPVDVAGAPWTYEETDIPVPADPEEGEDGAEGA